MRRWLQLVRQKRVPAFLSQTIARVSGAFWTPKFGARYSRRQVPMNGLRLKRGGE
jgi:hypothetical protein